MPRSGSVVRREPQRTCVACRRVTDKADLVRVVRSVDGSVLVDRGGNRLGRGAYLCVREACFTRGIASGQVGRALRLEMGEQDKRALLSNLVDCSKKEVSW